MLHSRNLFRNIRCISTWKKHVEALQEFKELFQCSTLFSVVFLLEEPLLRKASQKELFQVCFQQRNRFKNHMYISTPWTLSGTLEAFLVEVKFYSGNLFRNYPRHISNRGTFSATSHTRNIVRKFNRHFQCRKNSQWEPFQQLDLCLYQREFSATFLPKEPFEECFKRETFSGT